MKYLIFTYPNCPKCDSLKRILQGTDLQGEEYNLSEKESKIKIRDYLNVIKRDDRGGIRIPVVLMIKDDETQNVINSPQELRDWLQSEG
ncbi:MAG: hypothetical protein GF421_07795 [Candidatus Aminicenantes bacterium]|nr:hypothetical protein [Candidatus Aminicenantes bacterium]